MSDVVFQKHEYNKRKRTISRVEDFDPRPEKYRGTANDMLPTLLSKVRGQGLCISSLHDAKSRYWCSESAMPSTPEQPSLPILKATVAAFKESLSMSEEQIDKLEHETRNQRQSSTWFSARRYRLTSSLFGDILHRQNDTPPDALVLKILKPCQFSSAATDWGIQHEPVAIAEYVKYQHKRGHSNLVVRPSGLFVSKMHPFLGASPDGSVYDPSNPQQPLGFVEIKCPYAQRDLTPADACSSPGFCCYLEKRVDASQQLHLRQNHRYFAQVQGQLAVGLRTWCDFVIYTTKGISVERITFDNDYWTGTLLPKLVSFYDNCVAPEIVSPVHTLGLPLGNLSKK